MKRISAALALGVFAAAAAAQDYRVSSDQAVGGFVFPESAAYDPKGKALYVGNFGGVKQLAGGFKGPADFTVIPGQGGSMTVVVPDLPASQLRFIQLRK